MIVTGAEPIAPTLPEEPFWKDLTDVIDWAEANTRSAIWSCLAAHAAVLHLDGIERQRLERKCSGVYDCHKVADDWLMKDIRSPLKVAHSRINALRKADLAAHGYQVLTESPRGRRRHLRQAAAQPFRLLPGPSGIRCAVAAAGISARHHPLSVAPARWLSGVSRRLFRRRHRTQARQLPEAGERRAPDSAQRRASAPRASLRSRHRRRGFGDFRQLARISVRRRQAVGRHQLTGSTDIMRPVWSNLKARVGNRLARHLRAALRAEQRPADGQLYLRRCAGQCGHARRRACWRNMMRAGRSIFPAGWWIAGPATGPASAPTTSSNCTAAATRSPATLSRTRAPRI